MYDTQTDEVTGCMVGSKTWYHEKRHQWQYKTCKSVYTPLSVLSTFGAIIAFFGLLWGNLSAMIYGVAVMGALVVVYGLAEIDAEIHAWYHWIRDTPIPNVRYDRELDVE